MDNRIGFRAWSGKEIRGQQSHTTIYRCPKCRTSYHVVKKNGEIVISLKYPDHFKGYDKGCFVDCPVCNLEIWKDGKIKRKIKEKL